MRSRPRAPLATTIRAAVASAGCVIAAQPALAQPAYSDVVVFGDSLSDVGNTHNNTFLSIFYPQAQPPNWQGRFSNGPVWAEHLAGGFGLDASTYSNNGGTNYAAGGALSGSGTNFFLIVDNLGNQVDDYLGSNTPAGDELFVLWGGGNDFIEIGGSLGAAFSGGGDPQDVANSITGHIEQLAQQGGENFLVLNMPDLGAIPRYAGSSQQQDLTDTATAFNSILASQTDTLRTQYDIDIDLLDIQGLFDQMLTDPGRYGFTNTTSAAYNEDAGTVVADPNSHVFWDEIHPTARAHEWIATAAFVALQEEGDFTGDGYVGQDDLDLVLAHWGTAVTPFDLASGDWTGDGQVDADDLARVLDNWGGGTPPANSIPEPGSAAVLVLMLFRLRRRR